MALLDSSLHLPPLMLVAATFTLAAMLTRLAVIDLRTRRLPDRYTLTLILLGLTVNALDRGELPASSIWGAIIGYLAFWFIGAVYFRARGYEGLGLGDAKLLSAAGAWLGIASLPLLILMSALGALIYALVCGLKAKANLAFGPWLAAAFFLLWIRAMV